MDPQRPLRSSTGSSTSRPRVAAPARRRRPSRRPFLVRRLIVLAVVGAVVAGLVTVVRSVFSEGTSKAAGQTDPPTSAAADASATTVAGVPLDPTLTVLTAPAAPTTIAASAPADTNLVPTAADPARVLLVGDSEAGG